MPGIAVKPAVITEIQRQLNHELSAALGYLALANWCIDQNLKGFASFFRKQSSEEQTHADKFINHLLDRGVVPELGSLPAPKCKFGSILEVAQQAQKMEQANTAGINTAYDVATREKDYPSVVLLQWFVSEQVEEEDWADELVDRVVRANCAGGLSDLDRHIERYLTGDKAS